MPLHLLEHYTSVQGEGRRTGTMTQFVRFAGCNLRCPGWPCDTPQAIFPDQYKGQYESLSGPQLVGRIVQEAKHTGAVNVCYTGGEPLIQPHFDLMYVVKHLVSYITNSRWTQEIFTNGTKEIPRTIIDNCLINMDWKLSGSGEGQREPMLRLYNAARLKQGDMIKFVVKDEEDLNEARNAYLNLIETKADFWVGAAFGEIQPADIVEFIKREGLPWKLNVQTHKYIWPPEARLV